MGRPVADVQAAIENAGNIEVAKLENGFPVIATVSGGAPMLGFLRNSDRYGAALFGRWPMPEIILILHCCQEVSTRR